jgi:hypothetical protein
LPATLEAGAQWLLNYAQSLFEAEEEIMFTLDIPYVPAQEAPMVLVQAGASDGRSSAPTAQFLLKACKEMPSGEATSVFNNVDVAGMLVVGIGNKERRYINPTTADVKLTLLESTKNGNLLRKTADNGYVSYTYSSKPDYVGKDTAVFLAEFEGKRYKVVVNLVVVKELSPENPGTKPVCPEPQLIKMKRKPSSGSWELDLNPIAVADLPGAAVGQTLSNTPSTALRAGPSTGLRTSITLDLDAAGHGWFIDATPFDNSEFLPTSNPGEWIAKSGFVAEGKMDMLSVLLHEYGHVPVIRGQRTEGSCLGRVSRYIARPDTSRHLS